MNAKVIYYSKTGNTKKVAEVIAGELGVKAEKCGKGIDLSNCDLLCVGSGCYAGKAGKEMIEFLGGIPSGKGRKAAVFGTYGGEEKAIEEMKALLKEKGFNVIASFGCQGKSMFLFNRGKPEEKDFGNARDFARKLRNN